MALLAPGLGHLYAAAPTRALAVWLVVQIALIAGVSAYTHSPGIGIVVLVLVAELTLTVTIVRDAARAARRAATERPRPWFSRWPAITIVALIAVFGVQPAVFRQLKRAGGVAYRLPTNSMAPGLLAGDYVMTVPADGKTVTRGARVMFRAWGSTYVKRVVALPRDTIYMRAGELEINGHDIPEPYAAHQGEDVIRGDNGDFTWQRAYLTGGAMQPPDYHPTASTWGPLVGPPGSVFVLGDNRGLSMDSRYRGFVPQTAIIKRPTGIYFSRDPESGVIRWSRIGTRIE